MAMVRRQAIGPSKEEASHDYITKAEELYTNVYNILIANPSEVANSLYGSQPGKSELSRSLFSLDDTSICCLVNDTIKKQIDKSDPISPGVATAASSSSSTTLSSICQTDIRRLQIGSKVSQPLLAVYNDQKMVIKISKIDPRIRMMPIGDYSVIKELLTRGQISQQEITAFECWNPRADYLIACDNYTNDALIGKLIASIYTSDEAPGKTFNSYWAAALCQKDVGWIRKSIAFTGLIMMEFADYGPLNKIARNSHLWPTLQFKYNVPGGMDKIDFTRRNTQYNNLSSFPAKFVMNIFMQVMSAYDFLYSTHQFTHGDAKVSNLLVSSNESIFTYRGLRIDCPVTVKIVDFSKSSISIIAGEKVTRIFNYDRVAEAQLKLANFQPKLQIMNNRRVYRLAGVLEIIKLSKIRHGGLPFFRSFDIYTSFVSMMMLSEFLIPILQNNELKNSIWNNLWIPDQQTDMEEKLWDAALNNVEPTYSNVLSILDGVYLYCDLSDSLIASWTALQSGSQRP